MAEAKGKKSTIIYHDWLDEYSDLTDDEFGKVIRALLKFDSAGEKTKFDDRTVRLAFRQMAGTAQRNRESYEESCRRKSEYAKRREETKRQQKSADMCRERTDNDTDYDTDYDNDNESEYDICTSPTLAQIKEFFRLNSYSSDPELFEAYYSARNWQQNGVDMSGQWDKLAKTWELREKKFAEAETKGGDPGDIEFGW